MAKTEQNIPKTSVDEISSGDIITIEDNIVDSNGDPYDLTSKKILFNVFEYPGSPTKYIEKTSDGTDVTITDALGGVVECSIQSAETEDWGDHDGEDRFYRIKVEDSEGNPVTATSGWITVYA